MYKQKETLMKNKILIISLLILFNAGYAQTLDTAKLNRFFDRLAEENKAMGSLTIAQDGEVLYSRSIGYSLINDSEKKPIAEWNRFRIGSITKMFTAAIIFQLVEEGKLNLTDTLAKFFPQVPNAGKITIEHILAHRSGIHDAILDRNLMPTAGNALTKNELLVIISKGIPDFDPDTKHRYSNSGYLLLGLIIENLSGKLYGDALQERIISKAGLKDTYTATGNIDVNRNESLTYSYIGGKWKQVAETHPSILFSAGSIVSTPYDLTLFIQALFDGKIVSKGSLNQMKTIRDGDGLGMEPFLFAGKTLYGHTGGADNYGAWLAYLPEEKLAFAYTTNAKVYPVRDILSGIIDIYYGLPFQIPTFELVDISIEVLDKYVGVYSGSLAPMKFTITRENTTLFFQPGEQSAVPLEAVDQSTFKIEGTLVIQFDVAKNEMIIKRGSGERLFTKEK
jgi:D-alanyl-D-alanine carboxypeptidase